MEEVHMVVRIAKRYEQRGLDFCIITFYDPQRAAIIKALENAGLQSERVHNVDSFQGNEADYVILSSVRTWRPGFLRSQPRMNVALTRCKKGMVVVTDKCFLEKMGKSMLLGKLCHAWLQHHEACWIDWKAMLNNSVALPGLSLPLPPPIPLYGVLIPALAVEQLASYTSQLSPALTRIDEQSHPNPNPIHGLSQRDTTLPRDPPQSKPKTQTRTRTRTKRRQASQSTPAGPAPGSSSAIEPQRRAAVTATDPVRPSVGKTKGRGGRGGTPTAVMAAPKELNDAFASLQQLAAALDQPSSSRRRRSKRR
ncbi:AAA domain-containing protein [Russula ochroleuca]|uniref:AAA domain-containing protein n=1 Tax=Russula ochroleuca TaxID=152965 RepID=A0A9P5MP84_9AGAM|nr:AAA domain-containing protein [Russula ochroleuca]